MSQGIEAPDWKTRIGTYDIEVDFGHFEPNNIMYYLSIIISGYFFATWVQSFTPIVIYMGTVGAIMLALQIRKARKVNKLK